MRRTSRISPTEFDSRSPFGDLRRPGLPHAATSAVRDERSEGGPGCAHGILTALGGFNSNELLPHLDWDLTAQNPKVFCGYSDITNTQAVYGPTTRWLASDHSCDLRHGAHARENTVSVNLHTDPLPGTCAG